MAYITDGRIVPNFSLKEMTNTVAKDEIKLVLTPEVVEHAQMMQELRNWYGKPMEVSSWYRTPEFNAAVGGSVNSAHLDGRATDINNIPQGMYDYFAIIWEYICRTHNKVGGINFYNTFIHFTNHEDKFGHKTFQTRDLRK